jgi:arylsulfatase A-like enzyme
MKKIHIVFLSLLISAACTSAGQNMPNVLWLTVEDTSPYLFPAYGNTIIKTPNLDFLARQGVVFDNAFATGPQCSPARSSLISGRDATTFGNDYHREGREVPDDYFFPALMTHYYRTNQGKTDYNIPPGKEKELLKKVWDENGAKATYNSPLREEKPFFSMFNDISTHMSRMTTVTLAERQPCSITVQAEDLPPYVPNLPEIRADYALHLESIEDADRWLGLFLDDLKMRGLLDNTIIFFFSDHGGCLPRGKAFPFDTGFRSAFIAYVPPAWQHLWDEKPGTRSQRLVTFTDFGPTLLSLAGIEPPEYMQGVPFMGQYRLKGKQYAHTFRTNTGIHYDPSRSVYDGRYHYIRYYTPYKVHGLRQSFQWGMPAQLAWDEQYHKGRITGQHSALFEPKPFEMLFDLHADPWEMKNLANDLDNQAKLEELRAEVSNRLRSVRDLGFFTAHMRSAMVADGGNLHDHIADTDFPLDELHDLVEAASDPKGIDPGQLEKYLLHQDAAFRFWAASGFAALYHAGGQYAIPDALRARVHDEDASVAATAAEALVLAGETHAGLESLINRIEQGEAPAYSALEELLKQVQLDRQQRDRLLKIGNGKDAEVNFSYRSLLVSLGQLPLDSLYDESTKNTFLKAHRQRVLHWAPTRPNPTKE